MVTGQGYKQMSILTDVIMRQRSLTRMSTFRLHINYDISINNYRKYSCDNPRSYKKNDANETLPVIASPSRPPTQTGAPSGVCLHLPTTGLK